MNNYVIIDKLIKYTKVDYKYYELLKIIPKESQEYKEVIKKLNNNHKIENIFYNNLDYNKYINIKYYLKNKNISNKDIYIRIYLKITDDYLISSELSNIKDKKNKELETAIISLIDTIAEYYINLDFLRVFINELKKQNNNLMNNHIYHNIFINFSLEEELLSNDFNFKALNYLNSKLKLELIILSNKIIDFKYIDDYYYQILKEYCISNLELLIKSGNKITDKQTLMNTNSNILALTILSKQTLSTSIYESCTLPSTNEFLNLYRENIDGYKLLSLKK